jgi:hypothetical protein
MKLRNCDRDRVKFQCCGHLGDRADRSRLVLAQSESVLGTISMLFGSTQTDLTLHYMYALMGATDPRERETCRAIRFDAHEG